jgi:hypothetical protein
MVYGSNKIWYSWTDEPGDANHDSVRPSRVAVDTVIAPPKLLIPLLREAEHAAPSDMLFRREALDRSGGHVEGIPPGGIYEDTRLLAKLYLNEHVYKSSETWLWYRIRADSVLGQSVRTGRNLRSRLNFLLWFTDHVRQIGVTDLEFLKVLKETVQLSQRILAQWPWSIFVAKGNRARLSVSRQKTRVSIEEVAAGENWDIHLNMRQPGVEAGQPYRIRFMAKADRPRKAYVGVARADAPWDGLGWYQEIDLTNKWRWVEAEFVATGDSDAARVHFNVGLEAVSVDLKDVSLSGLDQITAGTGSGPTGAKAFNDKHHLGSWSLNVTEGNEAKLGVRSRQRVARVDIVKTTSDVRYDVQLNLQQDGIRAGRRYRIQFEARADRPRTASVGVARVGPPWDGLGWYQSVKLTRRWKHVEREFLALDDADIARVHFDLGVEAIPVEVRAVTLTEADPAPDSEIDLERGH